MSAMERERVKFKPYALTPGMVIAAVAAVVFIVAVLCQPYVGTLLSRLP